MVLIATDMVDTTTTATTTTAALQKLPNDNGNIRASQASLAADSVGSSCPLTHQYHYIQYPAHYFQSSQPLPPSSPRPAFQAVPMQCHCPCSCGGGGGGQSNALRNMSAMSQQQPQHRQPQQSHQYQQDGQLAVAVIVHQQSGEPPQLPQPQTPIKASQSAQSLLNHSYQALQQVDINGITSEQKRLNIFGGSTACDCDLECTCGVAAAAAAERALMKHKQQCNLIADAMLGADEITVSESDNNSTMIKTSTSTSASTAKATATKAAMRKKQLSAKRKVCCNNDHDDDDDDDDDDDVDGVDDALNIDDVEACALPEKNCNEIYHDNELEGAEYCIKSNSTITGGSVIEDHRPPLPPRPPPARARDSVTNSNGHRHGTGIKKYVVWCLICGSFSCLLGVLFLGVYFMLHSYTVTMGNFETIPTFVPATLLIMSGVCVMSLARRRNRYSYLIKLSGACGIVTALTCALVTVTTTVLHMSRLQALRECEYAQKTRTCTCYSDLVESQIDRVDKGGTSKGVRLVFDSLSDCGVVHGSLYSCLRAIFGLSVAGVLISVFSCMLIYQLLSHERKKMYWEQLELRCRSLYAGQAPPPNMAAMAAAAATGRMVNCRCCEQCHAHRQLQMPLQSAPYPWDDGGGVVGAGGNSVAAAEPRFWATQPPGNFYSPNPGGEEHAAATAAAAAAQPCRGHNGTLTSNERAARSSGWSWPRMPWQRNTPVGSRRFRQAATSPDSQYGFSSTSDGNMLIEETLPVTVAPHSGSPPFNVLPNSLPYGVWGPPPPYSDPNSPARRGYYQYLQPPNACHGAQNPNAPPERMQASQSTSVLIDPRHGCQHQSTITLERPDGDMLNSTGTACLDPTATAINSGGRQGKRQHGSAAIGGGGIVKAKASEYENTNTPSDSDGCGARERCSNTLPTRKLKKRIEVGAKSIGPNNQTAQRPNVQQVFAEANGLMHADADANPHNGVDADDGSKAAQSRANGNGVGVGIAGGVENTGYQCSADSNGAIAASGHGEGADVSESEVYFADVSSCCNMSVKNDNYYEDANQHHQRQHQLQQQHQHHHQHQHSNCSHSSNQSAANNSSGNSNSNEDYLAQRFGRRENSVRSRLPFPQTHHSDDYESSNLNVPTIKNVTMEQQQLQKDISRQSMCSVESEAKTEFTDLSPSTPCGNQLPPPPANFASDKSTLLDVTTLAHHQQQQQQQQKQQPSNFVASFPYASAESQCLEAHRRSTKNIHELMLNNESHYEVINDVRSYQQLAQQRPTNLLAKTTTRVKSRSREQLDNNNQINYQAEREWSDGGGGNGNGNGSGGGGGGGSSRTKRL